MADDWYKRDIRKAIGGMSHLTPEERGCYNTLIDHQYLMQGPLPDNDAYIAGLMNCDVRMWRRIKKQLVDKGRIVISGGAIADERASYALAERQAARTKKVEAGHRGGIASGEARRNKALTEAHASTASNQIRGEEKRIESSPNGDARPSNQSPLPAEKKINGSDEKRYWASAGQLEAKGVPRSRLGQLANLLHGDFAEGLAVLRDVSAAKDPGRYLGAIIRNRRAEGNAATGPPVPDWVREARAQGTVVERDGRNWRMGASLYDDAGEQIGW